MCNSEKENNHQGSGVHRKLEAGTRAACAVQPTDRQRSWATEQVFIIRAPVV